MDQLVSRFKEFINRLENGSELSDEDNSMLKEVELELNKIFLQTE